MTTPAEHARVWRAAWETVDLWLTEAQHDRDMWRLALTACHVLNAIAEQYEELAKEQKT